MINKAAFIQNRWRIGATLLRRKCRFLVWAPLVKQVDVHIVSPEDRLLPLEAVAKGYYFGEFDGIADSARYLLRLDGKHDYPDPASRFQPDGVHSASMIINDEFDWHDDTWKGLALQDYIIYELHIGTFTPQGTFEAAEEHLDDLNDLGVTAVEIMPVAQFPGSRNWGYDGVFPFAVQASYGGPLHLKQFVDACHTHGIAVILDVVYNHLGPEGNYLGQYGPYFTDRYHTVWGKAVNFDGPFSDEVRRFFIENALNWVTDFHFDALRLDALHTIFDHSSKTFLEELTVAIDQVRDQLGRSIYLIGESDANNRRLITPGALGGYGIDAQWNDDFQHSLHTLLTGESGGYYVDFGKTSQLGKAFSDGFVYTGEYSKYRKRKHGSLSVDLPAKRFVVFSQNHDQVGNRLLGERLSVLVSYDALKLAAATVLLSPFVPLLFMGEEYGETSPFLYFTDHSDPALARAVREGRAMEFSAFGWKGEVPDPQDQRTFDRSKLHRELKLAGKHDVLFDFYRELIRLRKELSGLKNASKQRQQVLAFDKSKILYVRRWYEESQAIIIFNFGTELSSVTAPSPSKDWKKVIDSSDERWCGPGSNTLELIHSNGEVTLDLQPLSFALFQAELTLTGIQWD